DSPKDFTRVGIPTIRRTSCRLFSRPPNFRTRRSVRGEFGLSIEHPRQRVRMGERKTRDRQFVYGLESKTGEGRKNAEPISRFRRSDLKLDDQKWPIRSESIVFGA